MWQNSKDKACKQAISSHLIRQKWGNVSDLPFYSISKEIIGEEGKLEAEKPDSFPLHAIFLSHIISLLDKFRNFASQ